MDWWAAEELVLNPFATFPYCPLNGSLIGGSIDRSMIEASPCLYFVVKSLSMAGLNNSL